MLLSCSLHGTGRAWHLPGWHGNRANPASARLGKAEPISQARAPGRGSATPLGTHGARAGGPSACRRGLARPAHVAWRAVPRHGTSLQSRSTATPAAVVPVTAPSGKGSLSEAPLNAAIARRVMPPSDNASPGVRCLPVSLLRWQSRVPHLRKQSLLNLHIFPCQLLPGQYVAVYLHEYPSSRKPVRNGLNSCKTLPRFSWGSWEPLPRTSPSLPYCLWHFTRI